MSTAKAKATSNDKIIVVLGLDDEGKPRAAKFGADQRALVNKAAALLKLTVREVDRASATAPVHKLTAGKIYSSGGGFVPNIRRDHYHSLAYALGIRLRSEEGVEEIGFPADWQSIAQGHVVLAQCDDAEDGWWEALVVGIEQDTLTLRWRYGLLEPSFKRSRSVVALLKPDLLPAAS